MAEAKGITLMDFIKEVKTIVHGTTVTTLPITEPKQDFLPPKAFAMLLRCEGESVRSSTTTDSPM
jgi:hypothetical protein